MTLDNRNVSKKVISNSFRGILRISPDENGKDSGISSDVMTDVTDSIGNPAPIRMNANQIELKNASLKGDINIGLEDPNSNCNIENLNVKNFSINGVKYPNPNGVSDNYVLISENGRFTIKDLADLLAKFVVSVPTGTIFTTISNEEYIDSGTDTLPYLLLNGQTVSKTKYSRLYNTLVASGIISSTAESVTTFKVPDYRGYFLRGLDPENNVDTQPDRTLGSVQKPAVPNIRFYLGGCYSAGGGAGFRAFGALHATSIGSMAQSGTYYGPWTSALQYRGFDLGFNASNGVYKKWNEVLKDVPKDEKTFPKYLEKINETCIKTNSNPMEWEEVRQDEYHNTNIYKDSIDDVRTANIAVNYIIRT